MNKTVPIMPFIFLKITARKVIFCVNRCFKCAKTEAILKNNWGGKLKGTARF